MRPTLPLTQAREAYGYTRIPRPYAGVVTKRLVELRGDGCPGTPLLSGFSLDALRVEVELPQSTLTLAREPADVQVLLPDGNTVPPQTDPLQLCRQPEPRLQAAPHLPPHTAGVLPGMWLRCSSNRVSVRCCRCRIAPAAGEFNGVYLQQPAGWA